MKTHFSKYDPAEDLLSEEAVELFINDAFQTGDAEYIAHALGIAARAKGMSQIARDTGLAREQLYASFSEAGNPTLKSTLALLSALHIKLNAKHSPL